MKRFAIAALSLFILGATAGSALAQFDRSDVYDTPMGSIYVSPFPDTYVEYFQNFPLFTQTNVYVVADIDFGDIGQASQNLSNGIKAWEGSVTVPPQVNLLAAPYEGELSLGNSLNDFIIAVGLPIITASSTPRPLVTLQMFATTDTLPTFNMELGAASQTTFDNVSIWQEYLTLNGCQNVQTNLPFPCFFVWDFAGSMLISNEVAVEEESFGGLKASFDR